MFIITELTRIAQKARRSPVLIGKVLAPAANGLCAIKRDVKVSPALTASHLARKTNGALLWNRLKVSFVLFIPKKHQREEIKTMQVLLEITRVLFC